MKRKVVGAQGEVIIARIVSGVMPDGLVLLVDRDKLGRPIIGHSESGHHHVLDRAVDVMEDPSPPAGMRILYALLEEPAMLVQDASHAHAPHELPIGLYEFRIAREYDPFMEQARLVAD